MFSFWSTFNFFWASLLEFLTFPQIGEFLHSDPTETEYACVRMMFFPSEAQWAVSKAPRPQTPCTARGWTTSWIVYNHKHTHMQPTSHLCTMLDPFTTKIHDFYIYFHASNLSFVQPKKKVRSPEQDMSIKHLTDIWYVKQGNKLKATHFITFLSLNPTDCSLPFHVHPWKAWRLGQHPSLHSMDPHGKPEAGRAATTAATDYLVIASFYSLYSV